MEPKKENQQPHSAFHGSDLEKAEELYGIKKEEIVSFGANVNPLGLSSSLKKYLAGNLDVLSRYPDRDYRALRESIGRYTGACPGHVLPGNGSTELISLTIRYLRPIRAVVLSPSYSEYESQLRLAGSEIHYYDLKEEEDFRLDPSNLKRYLERFLSEPAPSGDIQKRCPLMLVLCNPNNPTSGAVLTEQLRGLLSFCREKRIFVMIDETYAEFAPQADEISAIPLTSSYENLLVLRGVSKFWAAPGLRLGYAVTSDGSILSMMQEKQDPWSVNSLADAAGQVMFSDTAYIQKVIGTVDAQRNRICSLLKEIPGLKIYPPYANFVLVRILKEGVTAHDMFEAAIRRKMMIRDCAGFRSLEKSYFRFCFMKPEDNDKLIRCIREVMITVS